MRVLLDDIEKKIMRYPEYVNPLNLFEGLGAVMLGYIKFDDYPDSHHVDDGYN
jgi:hypothetical protein